MRLKNAANAAKRDAKKSASRALKKAEGAGSRSKCAVGKLPNGVEERLGLAQADAVAAETAAEALAEENEKLKETIAALRSRLDKKSKAAFDELVQENAAGQFDETGAKSLVDHLGKDGEAYSQEVIELAFRLMSACLSGEQAVSVVRAFVTLLHPDQVEGRDYRVPSAKRFNEWRRFLEPICHFIAVTTITLADRTHISNDATTKKHKHILMALYRCELPDGIIVDVVSP